MDRPTAEAAGVVEDLREEDSDRAGWAVVVDAEARAEWAEMLAPGASIR